MAESLFDFNAAGKDRWNVFAKGSAFALGTIELDEDDKQFVYRPNANAAMMRVVLNAGMRLELKKFCDERTEERNESGGNK